MGTLEDYAMAMARGAGSKNSLVADWMYLEFMLSLIWWMQ